MSEEPIRAAIEFGTLEAANEAREEYSGALHPDDNRSMKTVRFGGELTDDQADELEQRAAVTRADQESGPGQEDLTDAERRRVDWSQEGANVPKYRAIKAIAIEHGVDDWLAYTDRTLRVGEHHEVMEQAAKEGGGARADVEESDEQRARRLDRQASSQCDHAEDHCRQGDPAACEFLTDECDLDADLVEQIMHEEPFPSPDEDATPRGEPADGGEELPGEALGALKRSWSGYTAAVNDAEDALEAAAAELDHAEQAARAIHGIEREHGIESEPFVRLLEVHERLEELHQRHDLHRPSEDALELEDDGLTPDEDLEDEGPGEITGDVVEPEPDVPETGTTRDPDVLPQGFQGAMGAVVLSEAELEDGELVCAEWAYPSITDSPNKGLRLCREGDEWTVERWKWDRDGWETVGSYDNLNGAAGAMGHYARDIANDEADLIQDLGTVLPDRASELVTLEYDIVSDRENGVKAAWGAWEYDEEASNPYEASGKTKFVYRLGRPHHEAVNAGPLTDDPADLRLTVDKFGRITVGFYGMGRRSARTLYANYSLTPENGTEWTREALAVETARTLMRAMQYGPKRDALEDTRPGHEWKGPAETIAPDPPGVAPGSGADRDGDQAADGGLELEAPDAPDPSEVYDGEERGRIKHHADQGDLDLVLISAENAGNGFRGKRDEFAAVGIESPADLVAHYDEHGDFTAVEGIGPAGSERLEAAALLAREALESDVLQEPESAGQTDLEGNRDRSGQAEFSEVPDEQDGPTSYQEERANLLEDDRSDPSRGAESEPDAGDQASFGEVTDTADVPDDPSQGQLTDHDDDGGESGN